MRCVATNLLVLAIAWLVTVPLVLGLARLLDRATRPKLEPRAETRAETVPQPSATDIVVPLIPRGRNRLEQADELRRAS